MKAPTPPIDAARNAASGARAFLICHMPVATAATPKKNVASNKVCIAIPHSNQEGRRMSDAPAISDAPPKKRLAIFLDGTWNAVGDNTNVWRLKSLCAKRSTDRSAQVSYYGVGVNGFKGGGFGKGVSENIADAYEWLIDEYNPGDEIFIFGFSRGAYTARSLAGFIAKCGLLKPGAPLGVNQLYERYRRADDRTIWTIFDRLADGTLNATLEERWMMKYAQCVPIKFIGVWDTVGALGVPVLSIPGVSRSTLGFLHTGLRRPIEHGFHALAIDEHRYAFSPTLWTIRKPKDQAVKVAPPRPLTSVEQRWFAGAHANVGGGCHSDLLAQVPLRWIMSKASLHGLAFRNDVEIDGDVLAAPISDSYSEFMYGAYSKFTRRQHRPIGEPSPEEPEFTNPTVNETIDSSVFSRWRSRKDYRPPNLVNWAERHKVDIGQLDKSVSAEAPQIQVPD